MRHHTIAVANGRGNRALFLLAQLDDPLVAERVGWRLDTIVVIDAVTLDTAFLGRPGSAGQLTNPLAPAFLDWLQQHRPARVDRLPSSIRLDVPFLLYPPDPEATQLIPVVPSQNEPVKEPQGSFSLR